MNNIFCDLEKFAPINSINEIKGNFERMNEKIIFENSKKSGIKVNKIYDKIPKEQCNINKHKQIGQFSYENDPWFINMTTILKMCKICLD